MEFMMELFWAIVRGEVGERRWARMESRVV
jgi:hypothetical protein